MATWFLIAVSAVLGALLLWGLVAPRSQWRVLVGWSTADPDSAEPGDGIHGVRRVVCALGLAGIVAVAGVQAWRMIDARPTPASTPSAVQLMWGSPTPHLVDRIVTPDTAAPAGLVEGPLDGAQPLVKGSPPAYLVDLPRFALLGAPVPPGLVGHTPPKGYTGYGQADVVVEASGPLDCIPRSVVAVADGERLELAVYWGLPEDPAAAGATCDMTASVLQTVLIPVQLPQPVDDRTIVSSSGTGVPVVPVRK